MKLSYLLITVGSISTLLSTLFFTYFNLYINVAGLALSLASVVIGVIWKRTDDARALLHLDENRIQHLDIMEKIEKYETNIKKEQKRTKKLELSNTKLKQLMNKVTSELRKEHLSKESILTRIDKPIYALLLYKAVETNDDNRALKPLRDEILPSLGFRYVKGCRGLYVLAPSLLPLFKDRAELDDWVAKNIVAVVPKKLRYVISAISLIDLRYTVAIQKDKLTKKYDKTLLDSINSEELINFSEALSYLQRKKTLSLKDVIEIPSMSFLSDKTSLKTQDREKLKDSNDAIVREIEQVVGTEIQTKDFPSLDHKMLQNILSKYVSLQKDDITIMQSNAQFWVDLFDNVAIETH